MKLAMLFCARHALVTACAWGFVPAIAQSPFNSPPPYAVGPPTVEQRHAARAELADKTQKMWDVYKRNPTGAAHAAVAEIYASRGLRPDRANTEDLIALIQSSKTSGQDRAMLARIAGDLYRDLDEQGEKATQEKLRAVISNLVRTESERSLQRAAAFTYSRMGWFPDSMQLFGRSRFVWGDRDYYGELAHALTSAPSGEQLKIVKEIELGEGRLNDYAKEVLAGELQNLSAVQTLHPDAARAVLALLQKKEPRLPADPAAMGVGVMDGYSEWLAAVVALTSHASGQVPQFVLARMIDVKGDPRKLIAVLTNPRIGPLVRAGLDLRSVVQITSAVNAFSDKYAANPNVRDWVGMAQMELANTAR